MKHSKFFFVLSLFFIPIFALAGKSPKEAVGPFGPNVTGDSVGLGVDDCSATQLLNKAVRESGVNFLDKLTEQKWNCSELRKRDIYPNGGTNSDGCNKDPNYMKCYSNTASGFPAICVTNPRSVDIPVTYADTGKVVDHRARFDGIYVFSKAADGFRRERSWTMDANGCHPKSANLDNPMDSYDKCLKILNNYFTGGTIYDPSISKDKFCGGKEEAKKTSMLSGIGMLHNCLESYPQIYDEVAYGKKPGGGKNENATEGSSATGAE